MAEMKVKAVTIEFDFDRILDTIVLDGKHGEKNIADVLKTEPSVRTWYKGAFPTDPLGDDIEGISWYDLLERMRQRQDIYSVISVEDSIIRERIMGHLAKLLNVPYEVVYRLWITCDDEMTLGEYEDGLCVNEQRFVKFKRGPVSNASGLQGFVFDTLTIEECKQIKRLATARLNKK